MNYIKHTILQKGDIENQRTELANAVQNELRDQLKSSGKMHSPVRHSAIISPENLFATTLNSRHSQYDMKEKIAARSTISLADKTDDDDNNIHAFNESDDVV